MPEPITAPSDTVDLSGAPGADINWDELFPSDPGASVPSQPATATPSDATLPASQPPAPVSPSDFLKTTTGTVYKSQEDAIKGIEHKDTLIEQLRQRYILERGIDPITNQPVQPTPQGPVPYSQDPQRYFKDLVDAVQKNDPAAYYEAQQRMILDTLGPLGPTITNLAKAQATEAVSAELKDFKEVSSSEPYRKVLEEIPELKNAIELAESDYRFHNRLPGLLKVAYLAAQGRRMPELLRAQQPAAQPAQPTRPTTVPSTLTPPTEPSVAASLYSAEGRKALIANLEGRGIDKVAW